ncbi:glyoxalase/bleomycin resistance/dioxygenase family protein [Saccharothrix mutabilis subsp. mutabilis]|uniref:Glyoxalase/bleomycin resistance/dioxygenase family protein n=1 Tax=Saccharothrix mutabilis subsp. mutabilis TaxID=66855 RepID=A0ABP3CM77_9PSEU
MLTDTRTTTVLPVSDMDRASHFYADRLGLRQSGTGPDGSRTFDLGHGNALSLLPAEEGSQTKHTVLSFEVSDIAGEVRELESRGVRFEDYDMPDLKTVDHIADMGGEKAAWFCDSEGNYLCLHEVP